MATTLGDLSVVIGADIAGFESAISKVEDKIGGFSSYAGKAIAGAAATVGASIIALGAASIKAAGDIQALEKGFAATYKGGEDLSVALAKVRDLAKLPGLGLEGALQGATNLQAAGFSADLATRALGAFGNALATVGKGKADLSGVGLALSQIASKGKISAEEINQLAERVPQIRGAITAAFGTADTQALQKLNIDATTFVEGITKQLEKLPKVTGGINNAFENLEDAGTIALAKLGTSLDNAFDIEGVVNNVSKLVTELGEGFEAIEPTLKEVAKYVQARWAEVVEYFGPNNEGGRVFSDLADSIKESGATISAVFDSLNASGSGNLGDLVAAAKPLQNLVREIGDGFTGLLDTVNGTINFINDLLTGEFKKALGDIGVIADGLSRPLRSMFGLIEEKSANFSDFFGLTPAVEEVSGLIGGDLSESLTKVATLTAAQVKALDALEKKLLDNRNASRALGETYDFQGNKSKVLESGIQSLVAAGFAPGGVAVQGYVKQLRAVPEALDQIQSRVADVVAALNKAPEFKLKGLLKGAKIDPIDVEVKFAVIPDTKVQDADPKSLLPDYESMFGLAAQQVMAGGGMVTDAYDKFNENLSDKQKESLDRQRDFNTGLEALIDRLGSSIGPLIGDIAVQFGEAFASIATGTASASDAISTLFGGILQSIGGFITNFGEQLIILGIGKIALDTLFESGIGGPAAVAAGLALVAFGSVVSSVGKSTVKSISSGGSGSSLASQPRTNVSSSNSGGQLQPLVVRVVGTLSGRGADLVAVIREEDYRTQRTV